MSARIERFRAQCVKYGQPLTVSRRASSQGGSATTQTVYFIVKPMAIGDTSPITSEANLSGQQDNPYTFTCAGDEDIRESVDRIYYGGMYYRVSNANPYMWGGEAVGLACTALRDGAEA